MKDNMKCNTEAIVFTGISDFDPEQIFDCGQCFRWEKHRKTDSGYDLSESTVAVEKESRSCKCPLIWRGVAGRRLAEVGFDRNKGRLEIRDSLLELGKCTYEEAEKFWWNYFDLNRDYGEIKRYLIDGRYIEAHAGRYVGTCAEAHVRDEVMAEAVAQGYGIRILNQDKWETLVSFIISQNNNIPRIRKCIEAVARTLGDRIEVPESWKTETEYYALPSPEVLAKATTVDLAECRLGYRDRYLIETAKEIAEGGYCAETGACTLLDGLSAEEISRNEAIERLRCFCGVGPKVANCVALFCLGHLDSFPLDVWMKRVMNRLYGIPKKDVKKMKLYAAEHFAPYGGIAQQYLFYYITHQMEKKNEGQQEIFCLNSNSEWQYSHGGCIRRDGCDFNEERRR